MSDNIKPYQFIIFDDDKSDVRNSNPLENFNIKRKKFIPQFEAKDDKLKEFKELFKIKNNQKELDEKELLKRKKEEIEKEISTYIQKKKKEADAIIENAKQEANEIKNNAYNEGFKEGFEKGLEKGKEDIQKKINELISLINKLKEFEHKIIKENEYKIINLIIEFAKKIIKKELELNDNEVLYQNLKLILSRIVDKGFIEIKINSNQYDFIFKKIQDIKESFDIKEINLSKSQDLSPGDCIIETNFGNYDGRIKEQIIELEKALTNKIQ